MCGTGGDTGGHNTGRALLQQLRVCDGTVGTDTRSSASKEPPREVAEPVIKAYSRQLTVPSSATAFEQLLCPYQRMLAVIRTLDALAS